MKRYIEIQFKNYPSVIEIIFESEAETHRDSFVENINQGDSFEVTDIHGCWHIVSPEEVQYIKISSVRGSK